MRDSGLDNDTYTNLSNQRHEPAVGGIRCCFWCYPWRWWRWWRCGMARVVVVLLLSHWCYRLVKAEFSLLRFTQIENSVWNVEMLKNGSAKVDSVHLFRDKPNGSLARLWSPRPFPTWCGSNRSNNLTGIVFIKVPKAASSTVTGSLLRLARTSAPSVSCPIEWRHKIARERFRALNLTQTRLSKRSFFLITTLRLPSERALSITYFHRVSFHHQEHPTGDGLHQVVPSNDFILRELRRQATFNFQLDYVTPLTTTLPANHSYSVEQLNLLQTHVAAVLRLYDFIVIVERLAESMVVLAYLTQVPLSRLLTLSAKRSGSYYFVRNDNNPESGRCLLLQPRVSTPAVSRYLSSPEWESPQTGDRMLYAAANASLQRTLEQMGSVRVNEMLQEWYDWQKQLQQHCRRFDYLFCNATGQVQYNATQRREICYERDFGCGYACIDQVVANKTAHRYNEIVK